MNIRRVVLAALVVAIAAVCALAGGAFGSPSHKAPLKRAASQRTHLKPNKRLVSAIKALRAARQSASSEPLPANVAEAMLQPTATSRPLGLEPADAVEVASAQYPTWIVPGSNGVCIVSTGIVGESTADGVCSSVTSAVAGHLVKVSMAGPDEAITTGLVPDGNSSVTVTEADGSVERAPVVDNVYEVRGSGVKSVALIGSGGAQLQVQTPTAG
jgi:hypothetical protein